MLAATGLYQAYRELGSFGALTGTHYGRLLLAKAVLVLLVLAAAASSHARVRRARTATDTPDVRRSLLAELAGITGVLVVTVLLIGTAPARVPHGAATVTEPKPGVSVPR